MFEFKYLFNCHYSENKLAALAHTFADDSVYEQRKQTRPTHLPVTRSHTAMYEQRKQTRLPVTHLDLHV